MQVRVVLFQRAFSLRLFLIFLPTTISQLLASVFGNWNFHPICPSASKAPSNLRLSAWHKLRPQAGNRHPCDLITFISSVPLALRPPIAALQSKFDSFLSLASNLNKTAVIQTDVWKDTVIIKREEDSARTIAKNKNKTKTMFTFYVHSGLFVRKGDAIFGTYFRFFEQLCWYLLGAYYSLGTVLHTLHMLFHLIHPVILEGRCHAYPSYRNKTTKAYKGYVTRLTSHSKWQGWIKPGQPDKLWSGHHAGIFSDTFKCRPSLQKK